MKVYTKANASLPIFVPSMRDTTDGALCKLCVRRALSVYVRRSGDYRQDGTSQLFITYGGRVQGKPISKQQLSNWLVECIKFAYERHNLPIPEGVKDHQTCKMAVTYIDMTGADPKPFVKLLPAKFYKLDVIANLDAEFGRRVLTLAGSYTPAPVDWGGYCIHRKSVFRW